jgi:DNA polymerase III subunit chi
MLIVAGETKLRDAVDAALWSTNDESFLPHAILPQTSDRALLEPILIAADIQDDRFGAKLVALADGVWRDGALTFDRALYLFDGQAIDDARAAWRVLSKREDGECHYWRQDMAGRWVKGP